VVILAGNRFGKTHIAVAEALAAALGYRPWMVPDFSLIQDEDGKWHFPPRGPGIPPEAWVRRVDGLPINVPNKIVGVTGLTLARGIGEIIQSKIMDLWPKQVPFKTHLGPLGVWAKIAFENGSEISFGSATQTGLTWEGFAADLVVADEPIPKRVFTALRRGLIDRAGQFKWPMTPLGDANIAWVAADLLREDRQDVEVIKGTSWENPYADRERLEEFFNDPTLSAEERKARETGEVAALGRRIVTTFTDDCIIPTTVIEPDQPRIMVVDPHHARPPAIIWAAVYDDGEHFVIYREWPEVDFEKAGVPAIAMHDLAGKIKTLEGAERIHWRLCDPRFGPAHAKVLGQQYRSFVEEMADYDLLFQHNVDNDIDRGISRLRDAFKVDTVTKRPRISVMRHCANTIRALSFWAYEGFDGEKLKVSEHYKDFADVCRYLCMYELPIFSKEGGFSYLDWENETD
jgi:hypothetical protein